MIKKEFFKNLSKSYRFFRKRKIILFLMILVIPFFYGCSHNSATKEELISPSTYLNSSETGTQEMTILPSVDISTQTPLPNEVYDLHITLEVPQATISKKIVNSENQEFLYKDAVITLHLKPNDPQNAYFNIAYLNLDNLDDNGLNNSDIEIVVVKGNLKAVDLYPTNNAYYFNPKTSNVDLSLCKQNYPLTGFNSLDYDDQGKHFEQGNPLCIYTNEGRIAIISFIPDSVKYTGGLTMDISVLITVFTEKVY